MSTNSLIDVKWVLVEGGPGGDFCISATQVTFDQYDKFCEATGYRKPEANFGRGKQPVINVNVSDALAFCKWLSKETGTPVRLPEENEWEHSARGGKKSKGYEYSGSNNIDEVAWYGDNSGKSTHEVATKKPNELGIYDMTGNVWELCGTSGALRGGSWCDFASFCCVSFPHIALAPIYRDNIFGFRVLQEKTVTNHKVQSVVPSDVELALYTTMRNASRLIVQNSEMAFKVAMTHYGMNIYPYTFLKIFAYSAYLYEYAAMPFYADLTSGLARSALNFIGNGIEDYHTTKAFCKLTGLLDHFGKTWPGELMTCPTKGIFKGIEDGERAAYMQTLLKKFDEELSREIALKEDESNSLSSSFLIDCAARVGAKLLSKEIYGDEIISTDFVKDNYAFLQDAVEHTYNSEKAKF